MEAKFASTLRKIPWSLAGKAALFAAAWAMLPWGFFALTALALYFYPLFRPRATAAPFAILMALTVLSPPGLLAAFYFGAIFFLILGIKDFVFVRRDAAYEILAMSLFTLAALQYFARASAYPLAMRSLLAVVPTASFFILEQCQCTQPPRLPRGDRGQRLLVFGTSSMLLLEILIAVSMIPVTPFFATALSFAAAIALFELAQMHLASILSRRTIAARALFSFSSAALILGLAEWSL